MNLLSNIWLLTCYLLSYLDVCIPGLGYFISLLQLFVFVLKVGDRCQVEPGDKRGVIKYVGRAENLGPGFWIGVQYDEPLGKHDGLYVKSNSLFIGMPNLRWF